MKTDYKVGDTVWIYGVGDPYENNLTEGKIVHEFQLDGWTYKHYVVQVETSIEPMLYVHDASTLAPDEQTNIGFWQDMREKLNTAI